MKWNLKARRKNRIHMRTLPKEDPLYRKIRISAKKAFKAIGLDAYARVDFRVNAKGQVYVIDLNPNPDLGWNYDLCESCRVAGVDYKNMIIKCLESALNRSGATRKKLHFPEL